MAKKTAGRNFNYEKAAAVLITAIFEGDKAAADKFDISTRTVERYRKLVNTDEYLSELVAKRTTKLADNHDEMVIRANAAVIGLLERTCASTDKATSDLLHAAFGAYKVINENKLFRELVNARTKQVREDGALHRQVDATTSDTPYNYN